MHRRLRHVERLTQDGAIGEAAFRAVTTPQVVDGQRVAALRVADPRVQALLSPRVVFRLLPAGVANRDLRVLLARLVGIAPDTMTAGSLPDHLRRLRLHGVIVRSDGTQRSRVTADGLRPALFFPRTDARVLRPGLAQVLPRAPAPTSALRPACEALEAAMDRWCADAKLRGMKLDSFTPRFGPQGLERNRWGMPP